MCRRLRVDLCLLVCLSACLLVRLSLARDVNSAHDDRGKRMEEIQKSLIASVFRLRNVL